VEKLSLPYGNVHQLMSIVTLQNNVVPTNLVHELEICQDKDSFCSIVIWARFNDNFIGLPFSCMKHCHSKQEIKTVARHYVVASSSKKLQILKHRGKIHSVVHAE